MSQIVTATAVALPPGASKDIIDVEASSPKSELCSSCGCPVEPADKFCPACGAAHEVRVQVVRNETTLPNQRHLKCNTCGAEISTDIDRRSYVCPFCDSTYVVELDARITGRQRPEFVIGFAVTPEAARVQFEHWIRRRGWFTPGDLQTAMIADKLQGIYLPFWSFSMLAESDWKAQIGEHWYRTETYWERDSKGNMVQKTRRVQETEWWPLSGKHHKYHSGYLVSASGGLPQQEADRIMPFQLPALKRFEPYFLAGWLSEEYTVDRDEALKKSQDEFYRREHAFIQSFLPGDTHRGLEVFTSFSRQSSDLCLLPVYILPFKYQGKSYRFLLNGQTGKWYGKKPVSSARIVAAVVGALGIVLFAVLLGALLSSMLK